MSETQVLRTNLKETGKAIFRIVFQKN